MQKLFDLFTHTIIQPYKLVEFFSSGVVLLLFLFSSQASAENLLRFDIKQQRADKAIIAFAQKSNRTIVFSFDLAKAYQANELKGYYTITTGLNKLLKGTGLSAVINQAGQLSIQLDNSNISSPVNNTHSEVVQSKKTVQPVKQPTQEIEKIAIIGSRVSGRSVKDLPVPVDIISAQALTNTGQTEVGRMLQAIAPSFNFSSSSISDGTDALRPATLRGLGPDQTLVLINGKRRHQASLIHINTSVGRGTAGTDMNAIPAGSIKRIEVLRDGAAAQYGSDAIAGVINIVLNDNDTAGKASVSYGEYTKGDGETTNIELTKGLPIGESGFINTTFSFRDRNYTNRAGLHGTCQYSSCTTVGQNIQLTHDPRELNAERKTFRVGDADSQQLAFTLNAGYDLGEGEVYGFMTYSDRENQSAAFFRHNSNYDSNAPLQDGDATISAGFLPKINSTIKDLSYNIGYQTIFENGSSLDISYTYGENNIDYTTSDTINSSYANHLRYSSSLAAQDIRTSIQRSAFAYGLSLTLQTLNFDYNQDFELFSFAMGAEIRTDKYRVMPGEEYAYQDYDTKQGISLYPEDRSAGTQGFGGISPISKVNESRDVFSFYVDSETEVIDDIILSGALRYDNYDGFGDSVNFKIAANWAITPKIAMRSAISTGFRAPSMQQLYFNNISTQYVTNPDDPFGDQIALQVGTFRNDSVLAQTIGIPELKEEESLNFSLGSVIQLNKNINITIDYYSINIEDRIVISNKLTKGLSPALDKDLANSGAGAGQFFLNGADTKTKGVDIIATWNTPVLSGELFLTLAANITKTEVTNLFVPSNSNLDGIPADIVFSEQDISIIEHWQPQDRISLTSLYKSGNITLNIGINRYGEYTITDGGEQTFGAELLTDLRINYQLNEQLSFNIGGNNIFDTYPDKNKIGNSRTGTIIDENNNTIVSSEGVFVYSRRSAPFGFNGAYYYAGIEYTF